jgi:hypothetical protein
MRSGLEPVIAPGMAPADRAGPIAWGRSHGADRMGTMARGRSDRAQSDRGQLRATVDGPDRGRRSLGRSSGRLPRPGNPRPRVGRVTSGEPATGANPSSAAAGTVAEPDRSDRPARRAGLWRPTCSQRGEPALARSTFGRPPVERARSSGRRPWSRGVHRPRHRRAPSRSVRWGRRRAPHAGRREGGLGAGGSRMADTASDNVSYDAAGGGGNGGASASPDGPVRLARPGAGRSTRRQSPTPSRQSPTPSRQSPTPSRQSPTASRMAKAPRGPPIRPSPGPAEFRLDPVLGSLGSGVHQEIP